MQAKQLQPDTTRSFKFTFMKFQAEICRKYVNYLKYVIFLNNGKISKNIFFTYLHILFESRLRSVEDCDWNVGKCEVGVWKCKGCGECADLGVRESSAMQNVGA